MSADLDFNQEGIARFAFQAKHLDKVWHRHGVQVPDGLHTIDEWLDAANMDHAVLQAPLFAQVNGEFVEVPSHKLVYRDSDNKQLSVMGKDYRPVQSREAFGVLEDLESLPSTPSEPCARVDVHSSPRASLATRWRLSPVT